MSTFRLVPNILTGVIFLISIPIWYFIMFGLGISEPTQGYVFDTTQEVLGLLRVLLIAVLIWVVVAIVFSIISAFSYKINEKVKYIKVTTVYTFIIQSLIALFWFALGIIF